MDWKMAATTFAAIFLAEMGDKTQLAIITMSASSGKAFSVFLGGAAALILVTAVGVLLGGAVTRYVPERLLTRIAAVLFVVIGIWTWFK
jgi:putative Ca2+/H+ antiporter (TMEM165/GDT1 family)